MGSTIYNMESVLQHGANRHRAVTRATVAAGLRGFRFCNGLPLPRCSRWC